MCVYGLFLFFSSFFFFFFHFVHCEASWGVGGFHSAGLLVSKATRFWERWLEIVPWNRKVPRRSRVSRPRVALVQIRGKCRVTMTRGRRMTRIERERKREIWEEKRERLANKRYKERGEKRGGGGDLRVDWLTCSIAQAKYMVCWVS